MHLRPPWAECLPVCLTHLLMKMPFKILPTPSELHVMRCDNDEQEEEESSSEEEESSSEDEDEDEDEA